MLTSQQISQRLRDFITHKFPAAKERLVDDHVSLLDSGVIDSLGVLEIVGFLETEFGLTLNDDEMVAENFDSIATLTAFVSHGLEGKAADGLSCSPLTAN